MDKEITGLTANGAIERSTTTNFQLPRAQTTDYHASPERSIKGGSEEPSKRKIFGEKTRTTSEKITTKATSGVTLPLGKRWYYGAQIMHQKEILLTDDNEEEHGETNSNTETSLSLLNTPDMKHLSERNLQKRKGGQRSTTPAKLPTAFLIAIDEREGEGEDQEEEFKIRNFPHTIEKKNEVAYQNKETWSPDKFNETTSPLKDKIMSRSEKRRKSKQIKKILKERLNIDCLRMLCEESSDEEIQTKKNGFNQSSQNLNDSYHVLMKEIGIETNNEGLSAAFLQKNGEVQRQQLNSFTEMFSVRDLLGVGAFGVVLLVKNRITKEKSALKIIAKERLSTRAQKILKNESTIMQTMNHPSVVSLKRIFENQKFIILEMELIPGGQLKRLFKFTDEKGNPKPLSDLEASLVMKSLLQGVAYVHARDIVHRDLKPENILLTDEKDDCHHVKIVDFGLSAEQNWRQRQNEKAGTLIYMAPEQVTKKGYSKKVDLWACGIIAFQLLACGQHPCYLKGQDYCKKLENIETEPIEWTFPENFSSLAKDFFLNLCQSPPSLRYDAITALQHPWITRKSSDEIPLSKQQEFAMFKQESQLRKVMRLVYFASHVKMCQFSANTTHDLILQDAESLDKKKSQSKLQQPSSRIQSDNVVNGENSQHQSSERVQVCASTTEESAEELESMSPSLRFKNSQPAKPSQTTTSATTQSAKNTSQYFHNAFLQSSFASYKKLLLRESMQKNSIDSTSTKSKSQTSLENNNAQKDAAKSQVFQQDILTLSSDPTTQKIQKKTSLNKQNQRKNKQKQTNESNMLSPQTLKQDKTGTCFSNNINLNPAQITKVKSDNFVQSFNQATDPSKLENQANWLFKELAKSDFVKAQVNTTEVPSAIVSDKTQATQNNYFKQVEAVQIHPGRNLVSIKSPDRSNLRQEKTSKNGSIDLTTEINNSFRTKFGQKSRQNGQIESGSAENFSNTQSVMIDSIQFDKNRVKNSATVYPVAQTPILDALLTENTFSLQAAQKDSEMSSIASVKQQNIPKSMQNTSPRPDYIVSQAAKRNSAQTQQLPLESTSNEIKSMQDMVSEIIFNTRIELGEGVSVTKRLNTQKSSVRENERKFSRKLNPLFKQDSSPRFTLDQQEFVQNKDRGPDMVTIKPSKSNKKQLNQKRQQMKDKNSLNPKRLAHQATFDVTQNGGNKKTLHSGLNKINSLEDSKIDWFQMIQAEKTVGGSRVLQEHFQRGSPIYEHKDESMRSSCNPTQLNLEYFQKKGQPMVKQHAPLLGSKALSQSQKQNRGGQPTAQYRMNNSPTISFSKQNKLDTKFPQGPENNHYYFQNNEGQQQLLQYYSTNTPQNQRMKPQHQWSGSNSHSGGANILPQSPEIQNKNKKSLIRTKNQSLSKLNLTSDPINSIEESQQPSLNNLPDIGKARYGIADSIQQKQRVNSSTVYKRRKSARKIILDCMPNRISEEELKPQNINNAVCQEQVCNDKQNGTPLVEGTEKYDNQEVLDKSAIQTLEYNVGSGLVDQTTFTQRPKNLSKVIYDLSMPLNAPVQSLNAPKSLVDRRRPKSKLKKLAIPQSVSQESLVPQQFLAKSPLPSLSVAASNDSIVLRGASKGQLLGKIQSQSKSDLHAPSNGKDLLVNKNQMVVKKEGKAKKLSKVKNKSSTASIVQHYVAQGAKLQAAAKNITDLLTEESTEQHAAMIDSNDSNWWQPMLNGQVKFGGVLSAVPNTSLVQITNEPIQQQQHQFIVPPRQGLSYQGLFKCQQSPGNKLKTKHKKKNFNGIDTPQAEDQIHDSKKQHGKHSASRTHRLAAQINHSVPQSAHQMRRNQANVFEHRMASQGQQFTHKTPRGHKKDQGFAIKGVQLGGGQTNTNERQ